MAEIDKGILPTATAGSVVLQKDELAHWVENASLLEERVVSRHYEGTSQGLSFRIVKGVRYHVGAQRGHLVSDTKVLPVSHGQLVITNKRVIFSGDAKSFAIKVEKILNLHLYADGLSVTDEKGSPRTVQFGSSQNTDVVGALLTHMVNHTA